MKKMKKVFCLLFCLLSCKLSAGFKDTDVNHERSQSPLLTISVFSLSRMGSANSLCDCPVVDTPVKKDQDSLQYNLTLTSPTSTNSLYDCPVVNTPVKKDQASLHDILLLVSNHPALLQLAQK